MLSTTPLQEYVFYAPRTDLLSANREGLLSLIGYFSLQLLGIGIGRFIYSEMLEP
jgi:phosphatidylinositol glycan class W